MAADSVPPGEWQNAVPDTAVRTADGSKLSDVLADFEQRIAALETPEAG